MTNASDNKHKAKVNAIARLLELIEGVNQDLESSRSIDNTLLVKQYAHLKKDYTKQSDLKICKKTLAKFARFLLIELDQGLIPREKSCKGCFLLFVGGKLILSCLLSYPEFLEVLKTFLIFGS